MNSENCETSDFQRLVLNLSHKKKIKIKGVINILLDQVLTCTIHRKI